MVGSPSIKSCSNRTSCQNQRSIPGLQRMHRSHRSPCLKAKRPMPFEVSWTRRRRKGRFFRFHFHWWISLSCLTCHSITQESDAKCISFRKILQEITTKALLIRTQIDPVAAIPVVLWLGLVGHVRFVHIHEDPEQLWDVLTCQQQMIDWNKE